MPVPVPETDSERVAALRSYDILDTACEATYDDIVKLAARLTASPIALVSLIDVNRAFLKARHGIEEAEVPRDLAFCSQAILAPEAPTVVPDTAEDARFAGNPLVTEASMRFYAGVPLVNPEGHALGTLCIIDRKPREMTEQEIDLLAGLARSVATNLELRRTMLRMRTMAMTDALTGLANRAALIAELDSAVTRQRFGTGGFALLYLDLDGFKRVNDRLGHAVGDQVLQRVATLLREELRAGDIGARLGGDEFCALLPQATAEAAVTVAERLRASLAEQLAAAGWPVTASVGAITFTAPPESADAALRAADALMYAAKGEGKDRVRHAVAG